MNKRKFTPMLFCIVIIILHSAFLTNAQNRPCPVYYIAASARLATPDLISLRGTSNLPTGSVLHILVYDFIGEGSKILSEDVTAVVNEKGFFEAEIDPRQGIEFRRNLICSIDFSLRNTKQPIRVVHALGARGQHLGFPENPQAHLSSGENYYLDDMISVWD